MLQINIGDIKIKNLFVLLLCSLSLVFLSSCSEKPFIATDVSLDYVGDTSTCFSYVGYDEDHDVLVVVFESSGSMYTYSNFPGEDYVLFRAAPSLGTYYNKNIKGQYPCVRIK